MMIEKKNRLLVETFIIRWARIKDFYKGLENDGEGESFSLKYKAPDSIILTMIIRWWLFTLSCFFKKLETKYIYLRDGLSVLHQFLIENNFR